MKIRRKIEYSVSCLQIRKTSLYIMLVVTVTPDDTHIFTSPGHGYLKCRKTDQKKPQTLYLPSDDIYSLYLEPYRWVSARKT